MTCREKLKQLRPDLSENEIQTWTDQRCPDESLGVKTDEWCVGSTKNLTNADCVMCWNAKQIPEDKPVEEECKEEPVDIQEPVIKDSGDRTRFESGAVRDMRVGKGRCDLVPLEVVSHMLELKKNDKPIQSIKTFMKHNDTFHLYIALEEFCNVAYGGCMSTMFLEVAKHFEEGALKYGESNWQKGIPTYCYIDSAIRHYLKWLRGDKDEFHCRAFVWNLMCCIWEVDYRDKEESK